jgi:uncharacterized protein
MGPVLNELAGFVLQLGAFLLVPLIWYRVTHGHLRGFWRWLGLYRPAAKGVLGALAALVVLLPLQALLIAVTPSLRELLLSPSTPSGRLHQAGLSASTVGALCIAAVLKTGFTEEVLFRGFVAKRLIARLGLTWGNVLQAGLFMVIHLPLLALLPAPSRSAGVILFVLVTPLTMAMVAAWLNERHAGGSIVPGWILHGGGNLMAYALIAFAG